MECIDIHTSTDLHSILNGIDVVQYMQSHLESITGGISPLFFSVEIMERSDAF